VESLDKLRYTTYMKLCSSSKMAITPQQLPPTSRAAYYNSLHAHHQIMDWKSLSTQPLNPTDWGWQVQSGTLVPITTDQKPAPDDLLKVIRCSCKTTSHNACGTNLCSCRRNGLFCVSACSSCHGTDCNNGEQVLDINDTCSDEDVHDVLYLDDDLTYEYKEVVVGKNTRMVDENYVEWSDDCIVDDDLMPWEDEETVVASCSPLSSRD